MTINDFFGGFLSACAILACPLIMILIINWGHIKFSFKKEKIYIADVQDFSYEVKRHALYLQKLEKVYVLVDELDLDEGFYGDFKKKLSDEIRYINVRFQTEYGKELLEKSVANKISDSKKDGRPYEDYIPSSDKRCSKEVK